MKRILVLYIFWTALGLRASGQHQPDTLTHYLSQLADGSAFPGFAVSLVDTAGLLYAHAFGHANQADEQVYTTETIQPVGSISNTVTGMAIMKAVELGHLDLETNINSVLPFKVTNPNLRGKPIKVWHLATHTSGILDGKNFYEIAYVKGRKSRYGLNKFLRAYLTSKGKWYNKKNYAKVEPGTRYAYSRIGSTLAAYVVEVAVGMPFEAFTKKYIFEPCQMKSTGWFYDEIEETRHSVLYADWRAPLAQYAMSTYPDGSLRTSVLDLSLFLSEAMKGYFGQSGILADTVYGKMFAPIFHDRNMPKNMDTSEPNEGVFWVIRHNGLIGHTGSDPGVTALMLFDPDKAIGKIFMGNLEIEDSRVSEQLVNIWRTLEAHEDRIRAAIRQVP